LIVSGNSAVSGTGGGIHADKATLTDSTVSGNSANFGGGIIAFTLATSVPSWRRCGVATRALQDAAVPRPAADVNSFADVSP